jgi:hypothetical protein
MNAPNGRRLFRGICIGSASGFFLADFTREKLSQKPYFPSIISRNLIIPVFYSFAGGMIGAALVLQL